ncbi:hypothetical protein YC2023_119157 [Brassica napus]
MITHAHACPPPIGYPTRDAVVGDPWVSSVETKSKGEVDGFLKRWYIFIFVRLTN